MPDAATTDLGASPDAPSDSPSADLTTVDAASDGGATDAPIDAAPADMPSVDVVADTPPLDVPSVDVAPVDVPATDLPVDVFAPDAPPVDVAPDVSSSTGVEVVTGLNSLHSCALSPDGTVRCSGYNSSGQLGDGSVVSRSRPVAVVGLTGVRQITVGDSHSCALLNDGTARCWGSNDQGQLGNGTRDNTGVPIAVSGLSGVTQIAAGRFSTCAVLTDMTVRCWGDNGTLQLGVSGDDRTTPIAVTGVTGAAEVRLGGGHTCVRLTDGHVRCWGANNYGQLGRGTITPSVVYGPGAAVVDLSDATALSLGGTSACVLSRAGGVRCWGHNGYGQLGDGSNTPQGSPISSAVSVVNPTRIACGVAHVCAVGGDGTVRCWGSNASGQLGDGTRVDRTAPVVVALPPDIITVTASGGHSCAGTRSAVYCWGLNSNGQLGDGTTSDRSGPARSMF